MSGDASFKPGSYLELNPVPAGSAIHNGDWNQYQMTSTKRLASCLTRLPNPIWVSIDVRRVVDMDIVDGTLGPRH
jgi:hypothetical protein